MNLISSRTHVLLALSALQGVGPATLKRIAALPSFWERSIQEMCLDVPQLGRAVEGKSLDAVWDNARRWADDQLAEARQHGARILSAVDDEYPQLLAQTKDDPFLLFVKGILASEPLKSVAVIGTREPTQHGVRIAQRISSFFSDQRWSVVSGLALGCDAVAHQAALDARGHTSAVLAHGLHMIAPSQHKQLARDILDAGGALVSEFPFGRSAAGPQFVRRDKTQAGMAQGVVMVQSDLKGGSLHASRAALDYQRWLAIPYPTDKDRENGEPRVQANLVIADGTDSQRAALLRCPLTSLDLIRVVRGSADYLKLVETGHLEASPEVEPTTASQTPESSPVDEGDKPAGSAVHARSSFPTPPLESKAQSPTFAREAEAAEPVPPAAYRLEVGPEDIAILKTVRLWGGTTSEAAPTPISNFDIDVVATLSRLDHLQGELDELRRTYSIKRVVDESRATRSQFYIEDVLSHMKRVADQFLILDHGTQHQRLKSVLVKHGAATGQTALPLSGGSGGYPCDAPLVEVLDYLVRTLPRSIRVHIHGIAEGEPETNEGIEVHLGDLIVSFRDLVETALPVPSHQLS